MNNWPRIIVFVTITLLAPWLYSQDQQRVDSLMKSYENSVNSTDKADILIGLTDEFIENLPDSALSFAIESNSLSKEINYAKGITKSDNNIALIYLYKADLKAAIKYAKNANVLAKKEGIKDELINSLLILGRIYNSLGINDKSSKYLFEALKLSEELEDKAIIAKSLNTIGYVYFDQADYNKALEYYSKALAICEEINHITGIATTLNNIGAVYLTQNKYDLFEQNVRQSLKLSKETENKRLLGINYLNLGSYFNDYSNIDSTMFYYQKALSVFTDLNNIGEKDIVKILMAHLYFDEKKYDQSLKYAKEVLRDAQKYGFRKNIFEASELLNNIYVEKQDYINAHKYLLMQYQIRDSLNLDNKLSNLAKMEMIYKSDKEKQLRKSEEQRKNLKYIIFTLSLIFLFILTIIIIFNRYRIKSKNVLIEKQKLENDLELKNKEMTSNVMSLMKKNEILAEISKKLKKIEKEAYREDTKEAVRKIAKEIQENANEEIWQEFKVRFEEVHKGFYDRLLQQFPDLWPSEQRLCAFLRLNMTTKEISELTGKSIATLETARHRLRKKMGLLNTETNLITFLSRF